MKAEGLIDDFRHLEMQKLIGEFYTHQGKAERIKNFPLPRQYATSSILFIGIFIMMLPFGLMSEFSKLGPEAIWLTVPFTTILGWIYWLMEVVGDYAENPFEGLAFDVPTTSMCHGIEVDLREMLGETELPAPYEPVDGVIL